MTTKYIKKVLMCKPLHFSVDYSINPWMKIGSVNKLLAIYQWENLVEKLLDQRIKVNIINQKRNLPDMVFSADQGIIKNKKIIMSNFKYKERQQETNIYKKWFIKNKFEIQNLPKNVFFEGSGESLWWKDSLFVGTGFRTSKSAIEYIQKNLDSEVHELELINPYFYHLDTCLFPLNDKVIFYHPKAFSQKSINTLKKLTSKLLPFEEKEVMNFAANSLTTDHHVIVQKNNPKFTSTLKDFGYKVLETNMSEFTKAGGGIHCLVQVLEEKYA